MFPEWACKILSALRERLYHPLCDRTYKQEFSITRKESRRSVNPPEHHRLLFHIQARAIAAGGINDTVLLGCLLYKQVRK